MLPVVLIGDSAHRMSQLESVIAQETTTPVRYMEIRSQEAQQLPLPALTCPSIIFLDVDQSMSDSLRNYIARLRSAYMDSAIVVLLPFGDSEAEHHAVHAGVDDVLMKPVSPARIALSLRNLHETVQLRTQRGSNTPFVSRRAQGPLSLNLMNTNGNMKRLHHLEQEIIRSAIAYFDGHISNAAKALGIGRSTLYRKVDIQAAPAPNPHARMVLHPQFA